MNQLPSHGFCLTAFLLAYSARIASSPNQEEWVKNTKSRTTIMANACNVDGAAKMLADSNLVNIGSGIKLDKKLDKVSHRADRNSLLSIASLMLERNPPNWIRSSVINGRLILDLIPINDLRQLKWMGADLEPIILDIKNKLSGCDDEDIREKIGYAGELAVMSALSIAGYKPHHISLISDIYGYDISYESNGVEYKVEVKSCVQSTKQHVFISRNEYNQACKYQNTWRLIQVVFSSSIIINRSVCANDVVQIRELPALEITKMAPKDNGEFEWTESAKFKPKESRWKKSGLGVNEDYKFDF